MNVVAKPEDLTALRLLEEIERAPQISQREISRRVGVSLGLTNFLIRKMARKAWIKIKSVPGKRLVYALTPRGFVEKVRKTADFLRLSLRYYSSLKESIVARIRESGEPRPRVAAYRAGELESVVAEAVHDAGGSWGGDAERTTAGFKLVLAFAKPPRDLAEAWRKAGARTVDLY